jgi:oligosaccharide translocation protein RFT1
VTAGVGTYAVLAQMAKTFTGGIRDILKSGVVAAVFLIAL